MDIDTMCQAFLRVGEMGKAASPREITMAYGLNPEDLDEIVSHLPLDRFDKKGCLVYGMCVGLELVGATEHSTQ